MKTLSQNQFDKLDYRDTVISPYGIHLQMQHVIPLFKDFYEADGGDDTLETFLTENNIVNFTPDQLTKYITPKQISKLYWTIDKDETATLEIYIECRNLYMLAITEAMKTS